MSEFIYDCVFSDSGAFTESLENSASIVDPEESQIRWTHLDLTNNSALNWLKESSQLDPAVIDALSVDETRPRTSTHSEGILVYLRAINLNPGKDAEDMVSIRIWMQSHRIISARRQALLSVSDLYNDFKNNRGPNSPGSFLSALVGHIADRIGDFVNSIEEALGAAEDTIEETDPNEFRSILGSLRRQIAGVRRFLAPQRDALDRLNHLKTELLDDSDRQRLREESDRVSRYLEDLDLARERAVVLQEAFVSQLAQEQNARMYVLAIVTAIFLPLSFITGLFGMNVGGLPGVDSKLGFLVILIFMGAAFIAMIAYFKKKKWF